MRQETQANILHLLSMLSQHFATASLSVKSTRSGDAVRMLTFACMATICDATLRKIACDIPLQSSLHYSGGDRDFTNCKSLSTICIMPACTTIDK